MAVNYCKPHNVNYGHSSKNTFQSIQYNQCAYGYMKHIYIIIKSKPSYWISYMYTFYIPIGIDRESDIFLTVGRLDFS